MAGVAISGASGFIGQRLVQRLRASGVRVVRLVRQGGDVDRDAIAWDPAGSTIDATRLEGIDAVVHLAGESIAGGRWTEARKAAIRDSRVRGTSLLARALSTLARKPKVFVSASAIGIYGDRGDAVLDEDSAPGEGFLAELGQAWEAAADTARQAGIRTVHPRIGVVLDPSGGALAKMLLPFKLGLGGRLGSGDQFMSWIALDDAVRALAFMIEHDALVGPVNLTAPQPVTNREFTRALAHALRRPAALPVPGWALHLAVGELADAALLGGARVLPSRLVQAGFAFEHPELSALLARILRE
jgi:hypothetical protein